MEYFRHHFKRRDLESKRIFGEGTAHYIAKAIFHFIAGCDEILIVTSFDLENVGKVAIFLKGGISQNDLDDLYNDYERTFMPLGCESVYFIVESIDKIELKKQLTGLSI